MVVAGLCEAGVPECGVRSNQSEVNRKGRSASRCPALPRAPCFQRRGASSPCTAGGASRGAVLLARVRSAALPARPANEKAKEPLTNHQQPKAERETSLRGHRQSPAAVGEIDR